MSKDVSKLGTLFVYDGKLHETIGRIEDTSVIILPVRESDYKKCECGRPLPDQSEVHVLYSRNLQDHIDKVYEELT